MKGLTKFCINLGIGMIIIGVHKTSAQGTATYPSHPSSLSVQSEIAPLTVGDKVPDIQIANVINYPVSSIRLSSFRGKFLLIDFWGTTCSSCISALPKIDTIQKNYSDKLQVLTVTNYDTRDKVENTLYRFKKTRNIGLPIVLNDINLNRLFPHEIVSHVIWINDMGIIKAITGTEYVNADNVQLFIEGKDLPWPVKNDLFDFNYKKPLVNFSHSNQTEPRFIFSSSFTGYIDGIAGSDIQHIDSAKKILTLNYFNKDLLQLCDGSLNGSGTGYINPKRLIIHTDNIEKFFPGKQYYTEWQKNNTYSYSLSIPSNVGVEKLRDIIKSDLAKWLKILGLTVERKVMEVECLALVSTGSKSQSIISKGGKFETTLNEQIPVKRITNAPISTLIYHLNENTSKINWVINETGLPDKTLVDMEFSLNSFSNITGLKACLNKYSLDLITVKRNLEMCIITDDNH